MPQLMPLNWVLSMLMVFFVLLMLMKVYYKIMMFEQYLNMGYCNNKFEKWCW